MKYHLNLTEPHLHHVKITLSFITPWDNPILEMPVWTPGSYKIRDYSKHIYRFTASAEGSDLECTKNSKNQWHLKVQKGSEISVNYLVYADELTVRTSFLNTDYGLLSPASLFFYVVDSQRKHNKLEPITLTVDILENWQLFTSLKQENNIYSAEDFDELVDSPFGMGRTDVVDNVDYVINQPDGTSIPCSIALIGYQGNHNIIKFKDEMVKLQTKSIEMFGELPYDRYLWVLYVVGNGGGGLEHKFSNFSIINRWYFDHDELNYARVMSLEAHEHFHAYNIKRIRPRQLGPFEYDREVYTTLLWVAEGITSFYDNVFLPRTGIISQKTYWQVIQKDYSALLKVPGRFETSLSQSSFDAWIKLYQPHSGAHNLFVSYYLKGGLVAFMLDLEIRQQTNWRKSLDDFFKQMYYTYKESNETYNEENFRILVENATGAALETFWEKYIDGTTELPLNDYLDLIGMELQAEPNDNPYTGITLEKDKTTIAKIQKASPAWNTGLSPRDRLIAINKYEVTAATYPIILKNSKAGDVWEVVFIRDGYPDALTLHLDEPNIENYLIIEKKEQTDDQKQNREIFFH